MKVLPRNQVLVGDASQVLSGLLAESVDCVITSPPYAGGVRNYGGGTRELGRETTIDAYIANLEKVTRELHRVLKDGGTMWIVIGDVFARSARQGVPRGSLMLAPQRLALSLVKTGWRVRNVVCWHKPDPLPQSAQDRFSPTYESVLLATKERSASYYFDLDSVRVPHRSVGRTRPSRVARPRTYQGGNGGLAALKAAGRAGHVNGKNPGDLFVVPTARDVRFGHQATFPEALIEPFVLAGSPEEICVQCDRPWKRPVRILTVHTNEGTRSVRKVGELQRCECFAPSRPGVVLDPFLGTGSTAVVAQRLGRDWLGVELNERYAELARQRLAAAEGRAA